MFGLGKNRKGGGVNFKNGEELDKDYSEICSKIKDPTSNTILDQISSKDIKYYIEYNELDYKLFRLAIKNRRDTMI
jgi:hypothetical protein